MTRVGSQRHRQKKKLHHLGYIILIYHSIIIRTFHYLILIWTDCVIFTIVYNWFTNKKFLLTLTTKVPVCSNVHPLTLPYCIYSAQGGYIIVIITVSLKISLLNSTYIWSFSTSRLLTYTLGTSCYFLYFLFSFIPFWFPSSCYITRVLILLNANGRWWQEVAECSSA